MGILPPGVPAVFVVILFGLPVGVGEVAIVRVVSGIAASSTRRTATSEALVAGLPITSGKRPVVATPAVEMAVPVLPLLLLSSLFFF